MMTLRTILPLAALLSLGHGSNAAWADAITLSPADVGTSFTLNYNGFSGATTVSGLSSSTTFTLTGVNAGSYNFSYSISNTTSGTVDSRLTGFAFSTDQKLANASINGTYSYTTLGGSYPNGIGDVGVCFKDASTGSCAGGGNGGLADGESGSGTFILGFSESLPAITLSDFYVRYQSVSGAGNVSSANGSGSFSAGSTGSTGGATTSGGSTGGGTAVPEPGMIGLLGGALLALALIRRKRRQATVSL